MLSFPWLQVHLINLQIQISGFITFSYNNLSQRADYCIPNYTKAYNHIFKINNIKANPSFSTANYLPGLQSKAKLLFLTSSNRIIQKTQSKPVNINYQPQSPNHYYFLIFAWTIVLFLLPGILTFSAIRLFSKAPEFLKAISCSHKF